MRVIAGIYRRRLLQEVDSNGTRETKDRVKESIFNAIQNDLYGSKVLDLFAGSGSLGIEAISRGASSCVFVDQDQLPIKTIHANVASLKINNSEIHKQDALAYLSNTKETFDIILLDPPYHLDILKEVTKIIETNEILSKDGRIVALYSKNDTLEVEGKIQVTKTKTIGITKVSYLKWGI